MHRRRDLESIIFDACVAIAVLFFLYALLLPHFRSPSPQVTQTARVTPPPANPPAAAAAPVIPAPLRAPAAKPAAPPAKAALARPAPASSAPMKPTPAKAVPVQPSTGETTLPVENYAVDAGVFREKTNAEGLAKRIWIRDQAQAVIAPIRLRGRTLYRVRLLVGTQQQAQALAASLLKEEKLQARIRPIE